MFEYSDSVIFDYLLFIVVEFSHEAFVQDIFHVQNAKFAEGVKGVVQVTTQPTLSQVQRKCQDMCNWKS